MGTISLEDLVHHSLSQIVKGVKSAQEDTKDVGGEIVPTGLYMRGGENQLVTFKPGYGIVQNVEFDVALTSTETTSKGGGAGIGVGVPLGATINIELQKKLAKSQTVLNRIKFNVPVLFPSAFFDWSKKKSFKSARKTSVNLTTAG